MNKYDVCANLAFLCLEKTGTVFGRVKCRLNAENQRKLFGRYLGKGLIVIDGENETITHTVKRCFGLDYEVTFDRKWIDILEGSK